MASSSSASYSSSQPDVFLSFSGEDALKTFVKNLYSALVDEQICVYKDDLSLVHGESTDLSLFEAIKKSRIAVIVFSKNYAAFSRCLDELTHIMKHRDERGLTVMPVFYGVDPSEVRNQKGDFGKAFAKQEAENINKVQLWRKALVDASSISGNILKGNGSQFIKNMVDTILDKLLALNFGIDEDLVGMRDRLQHMESLLDIDSDGVRMVGIFGMGGIGKTTLAKSLYTKISQHFHMHCIVQNVREEASTKHGLKNLQKVMLSDLLKRQVKVHSILEGRNMIQRRLRHSNVLVILDDVDDLCQLEALVGNHNWFGSGSRIIIITRYELLLRGYKVDHVYHVTLLSDKEAVKLFKRYAYNTEDPIQDYETLSSSAISLAGGLPLTLQVLGSFLHGKTKNEWMDVVDRLKYYPQTVMGKLKWSYDELGAHEKEIFLDIACFFRRWNIDDAMEILEACGFHHPTKQIQALTQKSLVDIVNGRLDMHDHIQQLGENIVRQEHPKNPEKHSRIWRHEEIADMCFGDGTLENDKIEVIKYDGYSSVDDHSSRFCEIVSKMKKLRLLSKTVCSDCDVDAEGPNFLSNELRYIHWELYPSSPFPESFQLRKLVVLKLWGSLQKEVWNGYMHLPCLKVLQLKHMWELLSTPNFDGLPCLQKLSLSSCKELVEIHSSLVNHTNVEYISISECPKLRIFPKIVHMEKLKTLEIKDCFLRDGKFPFGIGELSNLQELNLTGNDCSRLDFSVSQLTRLKLLDLSYCVKLTELPELPPNLVILKTEYCSSLITIGDCLKKCKWLCQVSLMGGGTINDGGRLLQSMLEGKAIENNSMLLRLKGVDVANGFSPALLRGRRCRLQLPENWCNDFCGFMVCAVLPNYFHWSDPVRIILSQVMSGADSKDDVVWEESDGDSDKHTFVWYVSFGSLRHTKLWDHTYEALELNIEDYRCYGFGGKLVAKNSKSDLHETSTYSSDYIPRLEIEDNTNSALTISLGFYAPKL